MNQHVPLRIGHSACPHDCPSTCALEVEVLDGRRIGRVRGARDNDYTAGVICAKVARYAERIHNPNRLTQAYRRKGEKGSGDWQAIGFDAALDEIAEAFVKAEARFGPETVWPYYYAGTMGQVQRDGINRLRHEKRYSGFYGTICVNMAWTGYIAGAGKIAGVDPREMAKSDLIVIWGTNAVSTQVNVMTHAIRARKERGAKIVAVDIYRNETMQQADIALCLKPGTDGALACAIMHILFRDGLADRDYLARYTDFPADLEAHLAARTPEWASAITGLPAPEIEAFARLIGTTKRCFFRIGYGFSRQRNGAVAMHAVLSIPAVSGAWQHEGGGAFHSNSDIFHLDKSLIEGTDLLDPTVRQLDQSRTAAILTGDADALKGGPPVTAMLIQNTNPVSICPDQNLVKAGFARPDLFVAVHEQILTDTAKMADIVLPATMFLEHDDIYKGGGNQYITLGPKQIEPPEGCRTNHQVIRGLAERLGLEHPGFFMSERELIDDMLKRSGRGSWDELEASRWLDCQPPFEDAHFLSGFGHADGKYHFRVDWTAVDSENYGPVGPHRDMPELPDHWAAIEAVDAEHPFRLATSPSRSFLNSTFNETPGSIAKEGGRPEVMLHPVDAAALGIADGAPVTLGNHRGEVRLHARFFDGVRRGVVISEGIWPNSAFPDGRGINTLTGADPVAPFGGAAVHDTKVWIRPISS